MKIIMQITLITTFYIPITPIGFILSIIKIIRITGRNSEESIKPYALIASITFWLMVTFIMYHVMYIDVAF